MIRAGSVILLVIFYVTVVSCSDTRKAQGNYVMVSSVSSDGKYAITTNMNEQVYLWNLENKTYQSLNKKPVNIYSAYFIKNSDNFIYQLNKSNEVIIQNVHGDIIKHFNPGFATYGQVMTADLNTWIGVDELNQIFMKNKRGKYRQLIYHYCGPNYKDEIKPPEGAIYTCGSFMGDGKLFNLSLTPNEQTLLTTGFSETYIWQLSQPNKPRKITKTVAQTINSIASDGRYVVVADQQRQGFVYDLVTQKILGTKTHDTFFLKTPDKNDSMKDYFETSSGFDTGNSATHISGISFIDDNHYVISYIGIPRPFMYLGLYKLADYWYKPVRKTKLLYTSPIKYLPISKKIRDSADEPYPETRSFVRDQAMDSAPAAHVLVMGQANGGGIMVYRYNPETQELKLDWAPRLKSTPKEPWYKRWFGLSGAHND